ncbi:thioredoxin family protein [Arthrobacter sp. HLT1-21]
MIAFPILNHENIDAALTRPGLILLDFWQASCAPCRALEPRLEQFARRHPGEFTGYRIDIDTDLDAATAYDVQSIPTLILFKDGQETGRLDGLIRDTDLEAILNPAPQDGSQ